LKYLALLILFFCFPNPAQAAPPERLYGFVGAGTNLSFPGTFRIGYKDWEGGLLIPGALGAQKRFFLVRHSYVSFGPALVAATPKTGLGFAASVGVDLLIGWGIGFRAEAMGVAGSNGYVSGRGVLGVSVAF